MINYIICDDGTYVLIFPQTLNPCSIASNQVPNFLDHSGQKHISDG